MARQLQLFIGESQADLIKETQREQNIMEKELTNPANVMHVEFSSRRPHDRSVPTTKERHHPFLSITSLALGQITFQFAGIPWVYKPAEWIKAQPASPATPAAPTQFTQPFLDALGRFEERILSSDEGYIRLFRRRAGLENDPSPDVPDTALQPNEFASYYSLLMAYRLLDV
ncbi:hypothetical protein BDN72DRAFT_947342, partial [Pluteus cervinus]